MRDSGTQGAERLWPKWAAPLAATILVQTANAFLNRLAPTLGPAITAAAGLEPTAVGYLDAFNTVGSIIFLSAGSPLIRRYGPIRALQIGLLLAAFGVAMLGLPIAAVLFSASFLMGLGYGPSSPAGSDILLRHAPPRHRVLIFSVKQAGVPLGGVIAGLLMPALVMATGLRPALTLLFIVPIAVALAVQPVRESVDAGRDRSETVNAAVLLSPANAWAPLRLVLGSLRLSSLSIAAFCFAIGQGVVYTFLVTYLVEDIGMSLETAGAVSAIMQAAGIFGRVGLGFLTDRLRSSVNMLRALSLASAATLAVIAITDARWPPSALMLLAAIAGVTVASWNGIHLSELARSAPCGKVGETTAGATVLTFLGYVLASVGFAALVEATGSYRFSFALIAALPLVATAALFLGVKDRLDQPHL